MPGYGLEYGLHPGGSIYLVVKRFEQVFSALLGDDVQVILRLGKGWVRERPRGRGVGEGAAQGEKVTMYK